MSEVQQPIPVREMLDRYELISLIAQGGMGSVHLARLPGAGGFQRLYAIKVMHPHLAAEVEFVNMLLDEARIAARIHHPNAIPIVDVCYSERGFYLVMDYIEGVTVSQILASDMSREAKIRASLRGIVDALSGLNAAHDLADDEGVPLGIVHRDVSPQNIMVGADGAGRITDFGIALAASRIVSSRPGLIKGKPAYMSPEQVSAAAVDRRADLFCMGIVLWESLAGRRLFDADQEVGALMQVVGAEIKPPSSVRPEIPPMLDEVCMKALQRDLDRRWSSARAMSLALESAANSAGLLGTPHDVADLLRETFAQPFGARRKLIRDHARGSIGASLTPRPDDPSAPTIRSASIPAIEVQSKAPVALKPSTPSSPVPAPQPPPRRWVLPAVVVAAVLAAVSVVAMRHGPRPEPRVVSPSPSPTVPAPAPVPLPVVAPIPVVAAPAPVTPPTVPVRVEVPVVAAPVLRAPRRVLRDGGHATSPSIEANPYLQR